MNNQNNFIKNISDFVGKCIDIINNTIDDSIDTIKNKISNITNQDATNQDAMIYDEISIGDNNKNLYNSTFFSFSFKKQFSNSFGN